MKTWLLILVMAFSFVANAQTDRLRADRITADQTFILRGERVDSLRKDTTNWSGRTLSIPNAKAVYDFVVGRVKGDGWYNVVRDGGADTTGTNNVSAIVQAAINAGWKNIYFPHGTFLVTTQINMKDSVTIKGSGRFASRIKLTTDITAFKCSQGAGGNNTTFSDIGFYGDYSTGGLTTQIGIAVDSANRVLASTISGVNMGGFVVSMIQNGRCCATYVVNAGQSNMVTDSYFESNYGGVNFGIRAEYNEVSNCVFTGNLYGVQNIGGNTRITSNSFVNNTWGLYMTSGTNGGHGIATGNMFNHNGIGTTGANIYMNGITLGFNFSNNTFAENINATNSLVELINCTDIVFEGGYTVRDTIRLTGCSNTSFINIRKWAAFTPVFVVVSGEAPTVFNVGKVDNSITLTDVSASKQFDISHTNGKANFTGTSGIKFGFLNTNPLNTVDITGSLKASDSLIVGTQTQVTDTTAMDVVLRRRSDGSYVRIRADLLGVGGGGGTPGIDDVLGINQALTADRGIPTSPYWLGITSSSATQTFGIENTGGPFATALTVTAVGSGGRGAYIAGPLYGAQLSSTNIPLRLDMDRAATANGIEINRTYSLGNGVNGMVGNVYEHNMENNGGGSVPANVMATKLDVATAGSEESSVQIYHMKAGASEAGLDIQKNGVVRTNNNLDTLSTKAYARSLITGGGVSLTQYRLAVGDASNLLSIGAAITGGRALVSDANGVPTHATTTTAQINYSSNVTSDIQAQINSKTTVTLTKGFMRDTLSVAGINTIIPRFIFFDEFIGAPNPSTGGSAFLAEFASGTGANAALSGTSVAASGATGWGYGKVETGTTNTGKAMFQSTGIATNQNGIGKMDSNYYFRLRMNDIIFEDLSDGTETYTATLGFGIDNGVTNGAFFTYTHGTNSGAFVCLSHNGNTPQTTNTAVTVAADTEYDLDIEIYNNVTKFWINGTLVATNSTSSPNHGSTFNGILERMLKSAGTTNRIMYVGATGLRIVSESEL